MLHEKHIPNAEQVLQIKHGIAGMGVCTESTQDLLKVTYENNSIK
jgi:hypothetical protein